MYLGFDTSNYTTSVALFDGKNVFQSKKLLKVKSGEETAWQMQFQNLQMHRFIQHHIK